jgi:cytidylate kinase
MIITIDGPAGTGKSSVSQEVARRLGYDFLDTGAMYRAIGLAADRAKIVLDNADALGELAERVRVDFDWSTYPPHVRLDGEDVSELIRTEAVSHAASCVAVAPRVRGAMVRLQQAVGRQRPKLVTEGRDQGTVVFPAAGLKIYLTATAEERARRRLLQLQAKGQPAEHEALLAQIQERDHRDSTRSTGPLCVPAGAEVVDTTSLTQEEVTAKVVALAKSREGAAA